jgi:hypothetical protein
MQSEIQIQISECSFRRYSRITGNYCGSHLLFIQPPAKTLPEPAATEVQPEIASPTLPAPLPFTLTVEEPDDIGAACGGQGDPGKRCTVLTSPCLDQGRPFTKTFPEPTALTIPEQCATSESPILVAAGILILSYNMMIQKK